MKKTIKSLLMLLPLSLVLASCGSKVETQPDEALKPQAHAYKTYLVLTRNGLYNGEKGKDIPSLYLENTIEYSAGTGAVLPGKEEITSTIKDVEFTNWISYENNGKPTIYTRMPEEENKILYAFFTSKDLHNGEQSGNGGGEITPPEPVEESLQIVTSKQTIDATYTGLADNVKGSSQFHAKVTFAKDETWNIKYKDNIKVSKWETGEGSAFTNKEMTSNGKEGKEAGDATVAIAGTYDIYIKCYENGWVNVWVVSNIKVEVVNATYTVTGIPAPYVNNRKIGIWAWQGTSGGKWYEATVDKTTLSATFEIPNTCDHFIVASFAENDKLDWSSSPKQTNDIEIKADVTSYDVSNLWK